MKPGRCVLRWEDRTVEATVDPAGRVSVAGATWTVTPGGRGLWIISGEDAQASVYAVLDGDRAWVHAGGQVYVLEAAAGDSTRMRRRSSHGGDLSAPMPALVRAVAVSPGDRVAAGDVLVTLEAMKMELPIRAPRDGTISAVNCSTGDLVQPGTPLVEIA
jgi:biotin carboxyl carrier protein